MEQKSKSFKRRKFDAGFKSEALKMVNSGRSVREVARELGIGENLLYNWKSESSASQSVDYQLLEANYERVFKQLRQTEMERDILKKVISILGPKT